MSNDEDLPAVVPYLPGDWGTAETVPLEWLSGDRPEAFDLLTNCQACGIEAHTSQLFSFDNDGEAFFMCVDTDACYARVKGEKERPGTSSFLMDAVNKLNLRVEELEKWRKATGIETAKPVVAALTPAATTEPEYTWSDEVEACGWCRAEGHVCPIHNDTNTDPDLIAHVMGRIGAVGTTLVRADARAVPMDDSSVDLIVTSPPYWAQRSYTDEGTHYEGQIGDETTFDEYLDNLIACTREWMRVLKPSGAIWVNLGDKYSTSSEVRPKSLLGLPWRYALRCVDELGLILREEVIWSKPNGMPESVTDRCRRSHEQWFHFTKSPSYYSAVDRIRDRHSDSKTAQNMRNKAGMEHPLGSLPPSVWEVATAGLSVPEWLGVDHYAAFPMELPRRIIQGFAPLHVCTVCGEGRRPVKSVTREGGRIRQKVDQRFLGKPKPEGMSPMSQDAIGAHAGYKTWHSITGEACACTPYTDHTGVRVGVEARTGDALVPGNTPRSLGASALGPWREYHLDDWEPPPTRPGVVLDPFGGTGTTAIVAEMHGRHGVHLDLSADYLKIAEWRTTDPAQRAAALLVPKPPVQINGQLTLDLETLGDNE